MYTSRKRFFDVTLQITNREIRRWQIQADRGSTVVGSHVDDIIVNENNNKKHLYGAKFKAKLLNAPYHTSTSS